MAKRRTQRDIIYNLDAGKDADRRIVKVQYYGKTRYHPELPDAVELEQTRALQGARLEIARNDEFRNLKYNNLSRKTRKQAKDLKASMVAYAEQYGTKEQARQISKMNSARLLWMLGHGVIILDEYFSYGDNSDDWELYMMQGSQSKVMQRYIDSYNALMGV